METPLETLLLERQALRNAADEIVSLWWTGPYSPAKADVIESILRKHLSAQGQ